MIRFTAKDNNREFISIYINDSKKSRDVFDYVVGVYPVLMPAFYRMDATEILFDIDRLKNPNFALNDLRQTVAKVADATITTFLVNTDTKSQRTYGSKNSDSSSASVKLGAKRRSISFKPQLSLMERRRICDATMVNALNVGPKKVAQVPVSVMNIPPYQRERQRHVMDIALNWDDSKCNILTVCYDKENAWFNIVNGQHRAAAAKMRGIEYLICEILEDMSQSKEAALFVDTNTTNKKLTPFDTFKANQFINGEDETDDTLIDKKIKQICDEYGIKVEKSQSCGVLKSVPQARKIMKREGEACLRFIFDVIQKSQWDKYCNGYCYIICEALRKIYNEHINDLDVTKVRLFAYMVKHSPNKVDVLSNKEYPELKRPQRWCAILSNAVA